MKFKIGDQVTRLSDVYDDKSKRMFGRITMIYQDYKSQFGPYHELYVVLWSDGTESRGYLPHGLNKV